MDIEDYNYDLPEELIAQSPILNRSDSKLLVMDKNDGSLNDTVFKNITSYFKKGDVLVLNDTKVLPARIFGKKKETGASIELLLLKNIASDKWECLSRPFKRLNIGTIIEFDDNLNVGTCNMIIKGKRRLIGNANYSFKITKATALVTAIDRKIQRGTNLPDFDFTENKIGRKNQSGPPKIEIIKKD